MVDSMMGMQRSLQEDGFSDLIFEEKHKGKNFNALISKWISKLSLQFHNTKISFETRPLLQIDRCCRFLCEIEKIHFATRDTDGLNLGSTPLMGILLKNNIEFSGFTIRWEVAVQKKDNASDLSSMINSSNVILYGCQILSVSNSVQVNYTLLLSNKEPEFEINFNIDTVHVLLAPLPIHWMTVLGAQIALQEEDSSLSKNVKMTQSLYESFFPIEERHSLHTNSIKSQNQESIYYDMDSMIESSSVQNAYDDVSLDNFEDDGEEFSKDTATCASLLSNLTIFDDDGKMNTNFKASIFVRNFCLKILLQNPSNDFGNDSWEFKGDSMSPTLKYKEWDYLSTKFFGLLKTVDKCSESFESLKQFHTESGDTDYFTFFLSNVMWSTLTKKFNEKLHRTFLLSMDDVQICETLYKNSKISEDSLQIVSISPGDSNFGSNSSAVEMKLEYNLLKKELSLEISIGKCYIGMDISLQDRIRLLTQNDLLDFNIPDKSSSYELTKSSKFAFDCIAVINVSELCLNIHVPIVNLNDEMHSKSYWQYRLLHSETLQFNMRNSRFMYRCIAESSNKIHTVTDHQALIQLYSNSIIMSFSSPTIENLPILNIINDLDDLSAIVVIKIKSRVTQQIEENNQYSTLNEDSIYHYNNSHLSKKNAHKPYNTKESAYNNSSAKVIHTPADNEKIDQYIENSIKNSYFDIEIQASTFLLLINDKNILEVIYHRLAFDLLLWESNFDKRSNDVIINYKSKDISETDDENNTDTSYEEESNYSKSKSVSKSTLKKLTLSMKVDSAKLYLQTLSTGHDTESVIDLSQVSLFTDSDIVQGLIETQSIFIVRIAKMKIYISDDPIDSSIDNQKLFDRHLPLPESYLCVIDEVPEILIPTNHNDQSFNMLVLIMDSQLTKFRKPRTNLKLKQKALTMLAAQINRLCLRHNYIYNTSNGFGWLVCLMDLLSLNNPVITGYALPDSDTNMHLHAANCAVDLCFSHYPMSAIVILNKIELEMISNITESYHLNIEIAFSGSQIYIRSNDHHNLSSYFAWNNYNWCPLSLAEGGYCYITDLGNLDLKFKKIGSTNSSDKEPTCNLIITNSEMSVHFCSDSLNLIINCLSQIFSSTNSDSTTDEAQLSTVGSNSSFKHHFDSNIGHNESEMLLNELDKTQFNSMISDAMKDEGISIKINEQKGDEFCDGFLLVDDIFSDVHNRVISLETSPNQKLSVVQDHYKTPVSDDKYFKTKKCVYKDPDGYPMAHNTMVVHDFSVSINFYAGTDLDEKTKVKSSHIAQMKNIKRPKIIPPVKFQRFNSETKNQINIQTADFDAYYGDRDVKTSLIQGSSNRKLDESYQWKLKKINFRYALFSSIDWRNTIYQQQISRRLIFTINEIELLSRNLNSKINMVLFCDSNAKFWYDPLSPMISFKMVFVQSNPDQDVVGEECDIKLSIQPILLNFDQDFVIFVERFYKDLHAKDLLYTSTSDLRYRQNSSSSVRSESPHQEKDSILIPPSKNINKELILGRGGGIDSIAGSSPLSRASTVRLPAFDEMRTKKDDLENPLTVETSKPISSIFIRSFTLYPDIYLRLDYTGTRLDFTQGALKGFLYILIQLNNVVLIIKNKQYLEGITGFDTLLQVLTKEIYDEFISQINNILTKVGPISEISEMLSGIYDLFSLPYQYYHNERGLIEGLKLGTRSITTTSLWATLTLLSKGLKIFQKMAETTYDLVSPSTSIHDDESHQSARDFREGVTIAACGVCRRFQNTAQDMQLALQRSDRPIFGRMGDVIRQVPPVFASPIVATCEASNQLIDGLRYQLKPEMKIEDEKKWKH